MENSNQINRAGSRHHRESLCGEPRGAECGLKKVLNIIGGKWKVLILCEISDQHIMRYGELRRAVAGITNTMLAQSLREMEQDGLVNRTQYDESTLRVEYSLTEKAESMVPILLELKRWGEQHL